VDTRKTAKWRLANPFCAVQAEQPMANRHVSKNSRTIVNPRPQAVRLVLSDGTERIVRPWGIVLLPRFASDGSPLEVLLAEFVFSQEILSQDVIPNDAA
jgi:hypothetical protein